MSALTLLIVAAAVPLTVYIAQQQQEIRQRAAKITAVTTPDALSWISDISGATKSRWGATDDRGNGLDTLKIIENPAGGYLGVYHAYTNSELQSKLAKSSDLLNWTYITDLDSSPVGTTMPVISKLSNGGFLVAEEFWQKLDENAVGFNCLTIKCSTNIKILYYHDLPTLMSGHADNEFIAPNHFSLDNIQGTPNIYKTTISGDIFHSTIEVGFHWGLLNYSPSPPDRVQNARGTLVNFSSWSDYKEDSWDNYALSQNWRDLGARDYFSVGGKSYNVFEINDYLGSRGDNDFWCHFRNYLYDYQTNIFTPLNIKGPNGGSSFSNPHITFLTSPSGKPAVATTLYHFCGSPGETSGPLIYYKEYDPAAPQTVGGKITNCSTGQGIGGIKVQVYDKDKNPIATTLDNGSWQATGVNFDNGFGVWPQCIGGYIVPYNATADNPLINYRCDDWNVSPVPIGPQAVNPPTNVHHTWNKDSGYIDHSNFTHYGDFYDGAPVNLPITNGLPSTNAFDFCYTPKTSTSQIVSGRVTDCKTGGGISGIKILAFNNNTNPVATTDGSGAWSVNQFQTYGNVYSIWPQCVSGLNSMTPYDLTNGYLCNNSIGPVAKTSLYKTHWSGPDPYPHIGDYYSGVPSTYSASNFDFCYTYSGNSTPTPTPILIPTSTPVPTSAPTPTPILNDLALKRPVAYNGQWTGYEGYKAVDGNPETTWLQTSKTGWLYVDLGNKKTITKIYVNTGFAAKFYIQVSDDAKNWKLVWDHNWDNIGWRTQQTIDLSNSNISGRYVFFGNVDVQTDPYTHLYDFNVYGY